MSKPEKMTVTVAIGNSDDKLSQKNWHEYWKEIDLFLCDQFKTTMYQRAATLPTDPYQSAVWVFEIAPYRRDHFHQELIEIRKRYDQDSIAWVEGTSSLI